MTPLEQAVHDIRAAKSLDEISAIAERFSAASGRTNGALYSGAVGPTRTSDFVERFKGHTDGALIDETARARFLTDPAAEAAIRTRAKELFADQGVAPDAIADRVAHYLYGDAKAVSGPTTVENCLWGRASREYASTLKGDIAVLASNAAPDRVFARVELETALANPEVTSLGGVPTARLRADVAAAHGDMTGVLHQVQERFRADVARDAFLGNDGKLVLSREFAQAYHLKNAADFMPAASLKASGLARIDLAATAARAPRVPATVARVDPATPKIDPVAPKIDPVDIAAPARPGVPPEDLAVRAGGGNLARNLGRANVVITVAALTYDAVRVTHQYNELQAHGNAFAASTMVRDEALSTAGSIGGAILLSAGAGAAWGLAGGSETGPGALITGAVGGVVGGVIGAFGGQKLAAELTQRELDKQQGADGNTYAFKNGTWTEEHTFSADRPAPASQIPTLDFHRSEKTTDLVLAHPPKPDPNAIDVTDPATKTTSTYTRKGGGWETEGGHFWNRTFTSAPPALAARLERASAQRDFIGKHGTEVVANAFVADYYGKGWDKLGPLPESVTSALKLPSETRFVDPQTHQAWEVHGNDATRSQLHVAGRFSYRETVHASGDELKRVLASRDDAVAQNHAYGAGVIQKSYDDLERRMAPQARDTASAAPAPEPRPVMTVVNGVSNERVQNRIDELRAHGTTLPDVAKLAPFDHRPHVGSFVKISGEEVAMHVGRGEFQVLSVARDLHGQMPPEGRPVSLDGQGHVPPTQVHALTRH